MRLCERNMAGGVTDKRKQKQRGRYKEYLRHYNPYKFKAARRTNRRKLKSQTNDPNSTISHGNFNKSDTEFDNSDVFMTFSDDSSSVPPMKGKDVKCMKFAWGMLKLPLD